MPRGRPRDDDARRRVLRAAHLLVAAHGPGSVTIDQIAAEASVAKQTIYRWWPSKTAVILDGLVAGTMVTTPFPDSDDVRQDFTAHLQAVASLFASPTGQVIRELVGEAQRDPAIADDFVHRFWAPRRELSLARLRRGQELGQLRQDLDPELVLDAVYGPLWLRLLLGHLPVGDADIPRLVEAIRLGISCR